jgi:hypothetical protein
VERSEHDAAEEGLQPAGRRARSRCVDARSRYGTYWVVAARRGELVREAMLTGEKPWWTT